MRLEGSITRWDDDRGFGFIRPDRGGADVFLHIQDCGGLAGRPKAGLRLSFDVAPGRDGKPRARAVVPAGMAAALAPDVAARQRMRAREQATQAAAVQRGWATLWLLPVFGLLLWAAHAFGRPPRWSWAVYVGLSLACFGAYVWDKSAAERGAWRVRESSLHWLALLGGWPGALLAQQLLRHKSAKAEFRQVFWAMVVMNLAVFGWLAWTGGPLG